MTLVAATRLRSARQRSLVPLPFLSLSIHVARTCMYRAHADSLSSIDCIEPYTSLDTWQDLNMVTLSFKMTLSLKRYLRSVIASISSRCIAWDSPR
jgi:hypothetical protein